MQITYHLLLFALANIGCSALPQPSNATSAATVNALENPVGGVLPEAAQHHGNSAPAYIPGFNKSIAVNAAVDAHYANSAPWTGSGTFGKGKTICLETSNIQENQGGGAMFIGSEKKFVGATSGGNTKSECFFPNNGGESNCDMSLLDGYSLSVRCNINGHKAIGGTKDFWKSGKPHVDKTEEGQGVCVNAQGTAPSQSDVTPFFQEGVDGNKENYCIWDYCSVYQPDAYFPFKTAISYHVSGSRGPG